MRKWRFYQKVNNFLTINIILIHFVTNNSILFRLIKHTEKLLEEKEEKLCVKVLRTLREMMAIDPEYGEKVSSAILYSACDYKNHIYYMKRITDIMEKGIQLFPTKCY